MPLKRKHIYSSLLILVVASIIFYIAVVPQTFRHQVEVPYSMLKTGEQFNNTANLVKWYLPFAGNDSLQQTATKNNSPQTTGDGLYTAEIIKPSLISAIVKTGYKEHQHSFLFNATSDDNAMDACKVIMVYKSSWLSHWLDKGDLKKNARQSLENLKSYMEDTRRFYGFEIEQTTVADTSFVFLSETVPVSKKREATRNLFERLIAYAAKEDAGYNGTRIFYAVPYGKDQLMLFASIGVSKRIVTPPGQAIQYKQMPFGKNLLMASYQGPYGEVSKAYSALENFKSDHKLSSMAIPFQKFLSEGYDFADDQVVQMKVYYPVF